MDNRAKLRLSDVSDEHDAVLAEDRKPAGGPSIDGAGPHETVELGSVLQAIAARIDVVLGGNVAAVAAPDARYGAAEAWSSVVGERGTHATSDMRRRALATTVLRISGDGRLDLDDLGSTDDHAALMAKTESQPTPDRQRDAAPSRAKAVDLSKSPQAAVVFVHDVAPESPSAAATDGADVEERLRAIRERLSARQADTRTSNVAAARRCASGARPQARRYGEIRTLVQRLLIGLVVVAASAVVSIFVT